MGFNSAFKGLTSWKSCRNGGKIEYWCYEMTRGKKKLIGFQTRLCITEDCESTLLIS